MRKNASNLTARWAVLATYFGVMAMTHMLWLNLAPLASVIQQIYQVNELAVSALLLVFPLLYISLSLHSGSIIDRKGYRYSILLGSVITVLFSSVRIVEHSFPVLLVGQIGIAIGQPYIVNGIAKLIGDWFEENERVTATGVGTAGILVGMAVGLGLTPLLHERFGFSTTMTIFSVISIALTFAFFLVTKRAPGSATGTAAPQPGRLKALLKNPILVKLSALWFFAFGSFNGLTTWLEPILKQRGITTSEAGLVGASIIIGGIAGSFIIPRLSDRLGWRRQCMILSCFSAVIILWPLCTFNSPLALFGLGGVMGFLFLPGYPLVLAMCENVAGSQQSGAAISLLMLVGNAGAVVMILLMPVVNFSQENWVNSIYFMLLFFAITVLILLSIPRSAFAGGPPGPVTHSQ